MRSIASTPSRGRRAAPLAALACLAAAVPALATAPAHAAEGSQVSGKVRVRYADGTETPLWRARVALFYSPTPDVADAVPTFYIAQTGPLGDYASYDLQDGYYWARASGTDERDGSPLAAEWYDDQWLRSGAAPIHVEGDTQLTLDTIVLEEPGEVAGTVTDSSGAPVPGATVEVADAPDAAGVVLTADADGRYDTGADDLADPLLPGSYWLTVSADAPAGEPAYETRQVQVEVGAGATAAGDVVLDRSVAIEPGTPTVSGWPVTGRTLRADAGDWAPDGITLGYQWLADGTPVAGATGATYRVTNDVAGRRLSVAVTGTLAGGPSATATSPETRPAVGVVEAGRPRVEGEARVGRTLHADPGSWGPGAVRLRYQWLRDGRPVRGADDASYRLTRADRGARMSVVVVGTRSGFLPGLARSGSTGRVC